MEAFEEKFLRLMENLKFPKGTKIAIAVSGGGDSMALALLAKKWAAATGGKIIALTIDHAIRPESAKEARQVSRWLKKHKIAHKIFTNSKSVPISGMMEYARDIRYELLAAYCKKAKIKFLLTAHNLEDQAETFLLRLQRGSGVDGLSAIAEKSRLGSINLIRPLLTIHREELRGYLRAKKQKWIEDPTNLNKKYQRNNLRTILAKSHIEGDEILIARLAETAISMRRARDALEFWVQKEIAEHLEKTATGYIIDHKHFASLPEEIGLRILKAILLLCGNQKEPPRFSNLQALYQEIISGALKGRTLLKCKLSLKKGKIHFCPEF